MGTIGGQVLSRSLASTAAIAVGAGIARAAGQDPSIAVLFAFVIFPVWGYLDGRRASVGRVTAVWALTGALLLAAWSLLSTRPFDGATDALGGIALIIVLFLPLFLLLAVLGAVLARREAIGRGEVESSPGWGSRRANVTFGLGFFLAGLGSAAAATYNLGQGPDWADLSLYLTTAVAFDLVAARYLVWNGDPPDWLAAAMQISFLAAFAAAFLADPTAWY